MYTFKLIIYTVLCVILAVAIACIIGSEISYVIRTYNAHHKPKVQYQLDGGCPYMTGSGVR